MKKKIITASVLAAAMMMTACGSGAEQAPAESTESVSNTGAEDTDISTAEEENAPAQEADSTSGDTVEIVYTSRGNADEIKVYQQAVDAFNEAQSGVHVTFEASPSDGYNQSLITQLAGGTAADVIFVEDTIINQLIKNGTIANLEDFMATDRSYAKAEDFDETVLNATRTEDGIWGLSVDCNPMVLYYSPAMFEELNIEDPQELFANGEWSWDKFDEICTTLKENGKYGLVQGGDNIRLYNWVFGNGGSVWDGDTYKFDDKAREAFHYVCDRIQDGRFVYGGTLPDGQGEDAMFMSGQAGFIAAGRWLTKTFHDEGIDFDYIPYPSKSGEQYSPAQICLGFLCVNAKSEHLEEAMQFLTYYCGTPGQEARITGVGTSVPSVKTLDDMLIESEVPAHLDHILKVRATGWASGTDAVKDTMFAGFADATKSVFEEAYVNGADPDEVLEKVEAKAAEVVADNQ